MTTTRQINALLSLIADRNRDLVQHGPYLVITPLRHVIRSISIDRTSIADLPNFFFSIGYTCDPTTSLQGFWMEQFSTPRGEPMYWSQPGFTEAIIRTIEHEILPMLRPVDTIESVLSFNQNRMFGYQRCLEVVPLHKLQLNAAAGRFDKALEAARWMSQQLRETALWSEGSYALAIDRLAPLVEAGDRAGLAAMLRGWEAKTVKKLGIEAIYEATPFSFEFQPLACPSLRG